MTSVRYAVAVLLAAGLLCFVSGCADASESRDETVSDRADKALKDPFGYGPQTDRIDVSGGKINELDKKGLKKDIDTVLNP